MFVSAGDKTVSSCGFNCSGPVAAVEFFQDPVHVPFYRTLADKEAFTDLRIAQTLSRLEEDLRFPGSQGRLYSGFLKMMGGQFRHML